MAVRLRRFALAPLAVPHAMLPTDKAARAALQRETIARRCCQGTVALRRFGLLAATGAAAPVGGPRHRSVAPGRRGGDGPRLDEGRLRCDYHRL